MTGDDFRAIVLELDGVVEGAHMGHPDFRAGNGRVFASLTADERTAMVKVAPDEQRELLRTMSPSVTPAAGAWGRQGCTMVALDRVDARALRGAVVLAWENVSRQPAARKRTRR